MGRKVLALLDEGDNLEFGTLEEASKYFGLPRWRISDLIVSGNPVTTNKGKVCFDESAYLVADPPPKKSKVKRYVLTCKGEKVSFATIKAVAIWAGKAVSTVYYTLQEEHPTVVNSFTGKKYDCEKLYS